MNLKERNYAGDHLVVGSIEVLGNIKGGGVQQIKNNVALIQKQAEMIAKTQNQYWNDLASDGIISPVEKQMLLKEWRNIQYSQSAIYTQARSLGYDDTNPIIQTYLAAYNALYEYLYVTLKLFDEMEQDTRIESRETFNDMFNGYYYAESFVLIALSKGILDTVNIRSLESLTESGTEGEIGLYKSGIYQYVNGQWVAVSTGNYRGARNSLPATVDKDFFLVSEDFSIFDGLYINGEQLVINGEELALTITYKKGYIYYCQDGMWFQESDKANYRYVAAFPDVLNITGELPQIFQDALDNLEESLTDAIDQVAETVNNLHEPVYLGVSSATPQNPGEGDYFCYSGSTTGDFWKRSDIYRWHNGAWQHLDPAQSQYSSYYMSALEDILSLNQTSAGYFTALFTQSFFSNSAVIEKLSTRTLELRNPGIIKSENYTENAAGFLIDSAGNAYFNGVMNIKGNTTIDGTLTTVRNADIRGTTNIFDNLHVQGNVVIDGPRTDLRNTFIDGKVISRSYYNFSMLYSDFSNYYPEVYDPLWRLVIGTLGLVQNNVYRVRAFGTVTFWVESNTHQFYSIGNARIYIPNQTSNVYIILEECLLFINNSFQGISTVTFFVPIYGGSAFEWSATGSMINNRTEGGHMSCNIYI